MKKAARFLIALAVAVSGATVLKAMSFHDAYLYTSSNYVSCYGWLDAAETYRIVTVWLRGPNDELLDVSVMGMDIYQYHQANAEARHDIVGPGTYKCTVRFEEYLEGPTEEDWWYDEIVIN
jgi:hypothetical protein